MTAIFKKEMRTYFNNMGGYIFLFFFVLLTGVFFFLTNLARLNGDYFDTLTNSVMIYLVMIPMLTMRLFAEEYSQKTDQLLYTSPVLTGSIVAAKFLSAVTVLFIALLITGLFPFFIRNFGELPVSRILGTYLGYFLMGASFISIGLFISVLTNSQVISAVGSFAAIFVFFISDQIVPAIPATIIASLIFVAVIAVILAYMLYSSTKSAVAGIILFAVIIAISGIVYNINPTLYDGLTVKCLRWLSLTSRFGSFSMGILRLTDVVYYLSFAFFFNYLTINVIEKRRWV
jgi:ABC-2 type transport system permease protein